MKSMVLAFKL